MYQDNTKYQEGEPPQAGEVPLETIISTDTLRDNRLPPGQQRTRKWPVLHAMDVPEIPLNRWKLEITGLVKNSLSFTWGEFQALPRVNVFADFHCVTRWSRLGNIWSGVSTSTLLEQAEPLPEAKYVVATGYDWGWTTNLPLADFASPDALFADQHDGEPIIPDHGGPARLIVPLLYAWKSAKWIRRITLVAEDKPGYWEERGYHNQGDPWQEQRYSW